MIILLEGPIAVGAVVEKRGDGHVILFQNGSQPVVLEGGIPLTGFAAQPVNEGFGLALEEIVNFAPQPPRVRVGGDPLEWN
jgi:hypothetical protein